MPGAAPPSSAVSRRTVRPDTARRLTASAPTLLDPAPPPGAGYFDPEAHPPYDPVRTRGLDARNFRQALVLLSHKIRDRVLYIDDNRKMLYLGRSSSGSGDRNGRRIEWGE